MKLRPEYQVPFKQAINDAWKRLEAIGPNQNVCAQLATGGGKTVVFASIIHDHNGASVVIAHRKELVTQISLALAREGVKHRIIGPDNVVRACHRMHLKKLGKSFFDPNARTAVAGVNTIVNRKSELAAWCQQVTLWIQDEGHHVLKDNVWGEAAAMFPNAKGLGVTATPIRAEGAGLGRHADGLYDELVQGPPMRWLIEQGFLTDYRIAVAETFIDLSEVNISEKTGDLSKPKMIKAVRKSKIVGNTVDNYFKFVYGKIGVVFSTDVETATDIAAEFNARGVRAEVLTADTDDDIRDEAKARLERREIQVLVTVDLISEGFDLPAIEFVIFARPTASRGLRDQQFGRSLRPMYAEGFDLSTQAGRLAAIAASSKPFAWIIDQVNNICNPALGGLPDGEYSWSLDRREKKFKSDPEDLLDLQYCADCAQPYPRHKTKCPHCTRKSTPAGRSGPELVDGNLFELDAAVLAQMRKAVQAVDQSGNSIAQWMKKEGHSPIVVNSYLKNHAAHQQAQAALRQSISWWAGWQKQHGIEDDESYKRFYLSFGVDILSAQALKTSEAFALAERVNHNIGKRCV